MLRIAFRSARSTRASIGVQIRDLVLCAPDELRAALEPLETAQRAERAARFMPGPITDPAEATRAAMRSLACRYQRLTTEIEQLRTQLDELTLLANPALRAAKGIGADVASILLIAAGDNPDRIRSDAAFAAMCGASPIEASSGQTVRHRLNHGGNRQANHALWRIAMVRLATNPDTTTYAQRRRADGKRPARSSAASSATSPARSSGCSPRTATSPTPATCAQPARAPGSLSRPPPTTSTPGLPASANSNEASAATTNSNTATATGSPPTKPLDQT